MPNSQHNNDPKDHDNTIGTESPILGHFATPPQPINLPSDPPVCKFYLETQPLPNKFANADSLVALLDQSSIASPSLSDTHPPRQAFCSASSAIFCKMGGKVWSTEEERVFWEVVVPVSPHAANPAKRLLTWPQCAELMTREVGANARREYTNTMLCKQ